MLCINFYLMVMRTKKRVKKNKKWGNYILNISCVNGIVTLASMNAAITSSIIINPIRSIASTAIYIETFKCSFNGFEFSSLFNNRRRNTNIA